MLARTGVEEMVGPCGLEPQTSSVSRKRSSQLSYGPDDKNILAQRMRFEPAGPCHAGYDWRLDCCSSFSTEELGVSVALRRQVGQRQPVAPMGIGANGSSLHQQCPSGLQVIEELQFWQRVSISHIIAHSAMTR
jgi:hypothetical protein